MSSTLCNEIASYAIQQIIVNVFDSYWVPYNSNFELN